MTMRSFGGALVGLALAAFGSAAVAQVPIKIGFHAGLTGPAAADGLGAQTAVKMAIDEANRAGGIAGRKLELVIYDDQGKPEVVVPLANKLIGDDKVAAVISSGFSAPTKAAAPVFQEARIPYVVSIALQPDITKAGDFVFRVGVMGEVEGRAGAKLVGELLGKKRIALLTIKTDFGKSIATGLREAAPKFGVEIVKEYEYSPGDRQFGPVAASVKADNPDAIYASGFYFTGGPLLAQLRAAGITVPFAGAQSYSSAKFVEIAGPAAEGAVITNVIDWASKNAADQKFFADFAKAAGTQAEAASGQSYAAAQVLLAALTAAGGTDPAKLRAALAATRLHTVAGDLSFNARREVKRNFPVSIVKDGKWTSHALLDDAVLFAPPEN